MYRLRKKSALGILLPPSGENNSVRIIYSGKKDILTGGYFIDSGEEHVYYNSAQSFIGDFFSCRTALPYGFLEDADLTLEAKVITDLIRRPPPLTMLDPFYRAEITETAWTRLGH